MKSGQDSVAAWMGHGWERSGVPRNEIQQEPRKKKAMDNLPKLGGDNDARPPACFYVNDGQGYRQAQHPSSDSALPK
jgi:hypothetical protein